MEPPGAVDEAEKTEERKKLRGGGGGGGGGAVNETEEQEKKKQKAEKQKERKKLRGRRRREFTSRLYSQHNILRQDRSKLSCYPFLHHLVLPSSFLPSFLPS